MDARTIRTYGRIYSIAEAAVIRESENESVVIPSGTKLASGNPVLGATKMLQRANAMHALTEEDDERLAALFASVDADDDMGEIPTEDQGHWWIGYYREKSARTSGGGTLRGLRRAAGLTQAELAGRMGVGQGLVSKWETGIQRPSEASADALAAALGVSRDEIDKCLS